MEDKVSIFDEYGVEPRPESLKLATVQIQFFDAAYDYFLEDIVYDLGKDVDLILFPAGLYFVEEMNKEVLVEWEDYLSDLLKNFDSEATICLGLDAQEGREQYVLAVDRNGIQALGQRWFGFPGQDLVLGEDYLGKTLGYDRILDIKGRKLYLALCEDIFGLVSRPVPEVDLILNPVHSFMPEKESQASYSYYMEEGVEKILEEWKKPLILSSHFIRNQVEEDQVFALDGDQDWEPILNLYYGEEDDDKNIELALIYEYE